MEWINGIIFWHWLILAVVLVILEILMPGAYFLWMGIAASAVGGTMFIFPGIPFLMQILFFAVLSVITVLIYKAHRKNNPVVTDEPALNRRGEQYIGRSFTLTEPIVHGRGKITVDDSTWKISGENMQAGAEVRVVYAEGSTLVVEGLTTMTDDS